jgi:hypothetical protein
MSTATGTRQRIFISYRREEASGHAGRIYDAMVARFGEDNVFMDVDIAPGVDFVDHITGVVSSCTVLIAVMGKSWAETPGPDGLPRLQDEADFVRLEVGTAVQNPDVTVIPALVDKAQMPKSDQLPEEMRPLARRNALELSDGRWRYDVGRLNDTLEQLLEGLTGFPAQMQPETEKPTPAPPTPVPEVASPTLPLPPPGPPEPEPRAYSLAEGARFVLEGVAIAAIAAYVGRALGDGFRPLTGGDAVVGNVALRRTEAWVLVGISLALWLGVRTKRTDLVRCGLLGLVIGAVAGLLYGFVFAIPVFHPETDLEGTARENWDVLSLMIAGGLMGSLIGTLWPRPRLFAGLLAGAAGGVLIQAILNNRDWNTEDMPGVAWVFAARAGVVTGVTLAVLLLLDYRRAALSRSSSSAKAPAGS